MAKAPGNSGEHRSQPQEYNYPPTYLSSLPIYLAFRRSSATSAHVFSLAQSSALFP